MRHCRRYPPSHPRRRKKYLGHHRVSDFFFVASSVMLSIMEVVVIYEDNDVVVVSKPAGLVVHLDGRTDEETLVDWVKKKYPQLKDVGGMHTLDSGRYAERYGIVHRLDRETSGIILIAKTDEAFYFLQRQFLDHTIQKTYNAFVHGVPNPPSGIVTLPIGRSRSDFRRWTTGEDARGTLRSAITEYRVLASTQNEKFSLVECKPKTGRTHQLRVHMRALGFPILADSRYDSPQALGFTRLALHACAISVILPSGGQKIFMAPEPDDFLAAHKIFNQM